MGVYYEAKIGYGYPVTGDDFPDYDFDDEESAKAYDDWRDKFHDSEFCSSLNYYWDFDCYFFGIMVDGVECGEFKSLSDMHFDRYEIDQETWDKCEKEYHELFPNSEQEPDFYLMSVVW